ncbi:NAD(P)/FAD-dependent oxidoreductase [Flavisolibacter nicotianae]|uniref:NAD(P)/FAD-dependent oxidoreductase n=1 Tax=Flavisolibacter nicotianae TaxID=2364882 RepID=UPI000EB01D57|nr:FAD-dependent oxidoreductase [Flavisolibacter nicotianae]
MEHFPEYDVAIIGGGLAGLAAAILLRRKGHSVVLLEKETYPFHKVCGEYISWESRDFLQSLGLPLQEWNLPTIDILKLTAASGRVFTTRLPLGGFGVSRYRLDSALADLAEREGVHLLQNTKADGFEQGERFTVSFRQHKINARLCLAAYGKRSNLDVKWNRPFLQQQNKRLNNFVGIKYHVQTSWPSNVIGLHNFENGYCGISKIENDTYCLCYMTRAENLKQNGNNIEAMQQKVLYQNPHLKKIFESSAVVRGFPVSISQISFAQKSTVENGVLMLGDTAGMITPLCGNGMSIALHTAKIATTLGDAFLQQQLSRTELEKNYTKAWDVQFARRLQAGRLLQRFFGSNRLSNGFVHAFRLAPFLAAPVIRLTHGKPF